jgi:hypothetical protein
VVVVEILVALAGVALVYSTLSAAIRTVVVPRAEQVLLNRVVFRAVRNGFELFAKEGRPYLHRDRVMARYAPTALMVLPLVWALGVMTGFTAVYWALDIRPLRNAVVLSGSSLTTLGFERAGDLAVLVIAVFEALIGLGLVALLISFLPTMYGHFSKREILVTKLYNLAVEGDHPSPATLLGRIHTIGGLDDRSNQMLREWETWFVELDETHTSFPALAFFRSPQPERCWVNAAAVVLDTAALQLSCIDRPRDPQAAITIRAGFLALRSVADFFGIPFDPDPAPDAPISITRDEFFVVFDELAAAGLPMRSDRERAWRDFAGWRVNYDETITRLASLVVAPRQPWVSDREIRFRSPVRRHRADGR